MMEENNDIFLAGGDFLVYWTVPMHKSTPQHLFGVIQFFKHSVPCKHMFAFRVTVSAVGLFKKILLNTIAHMSWAV